MTVPSQFPSATSMRRMGLHPFPLTDEVAGVKNSGKSPRFAHWQELAADSNPEMLTHWDAQQWNLGLSLGPSGLVVLDSDTAEAEAWAGANLPPTPWMTATARGRHRFFQVHPGATPPCNRNRVIECGLDRKAAGGYVVAPGSRHYTGVRYESEGDWSLPIDALPFYDPGWFPEQRQGLTATVRPEAGGQSALERASAYLYKVPPAIEGNGGDAHTFQVACVLVRGFGLSISQALPIFQAWNMTCQPPWSLAGLLAKLRNAERYGTGPIGHLLRRQR